MLRGGLAGIGARGGLGSVDAAAVTPSRDWPKLMRSQDPGGAFVSGTTRFHYAGQTTNDIYTSANALPQYVASFNNLYGGTGAGEWMLAIPEWFPVAGTIRRIAWATDNGGAGLSRNQVHIYDSTLITSAVPAYEGWPYPGSLLASGTEYLSMTQGTLVRAGFRMLHDEIDLHVDAGTLLWFVIRLNSHIVSGGGGGLSIGKYSVHPWMGFALGGPTSFGVDNASCGYGWYHTHTFASGAAAVTTFPQTAPAIMKCGSGSAQESVPTVAFGFAAD